MAAICGEAAIGAVAWPFAARAQQTSPLRRDEVPTHSNRGRIGEPRIGAYALGPVDVIQVGLGADHGAVGAFYSVDEAVARVGLQLWIAI
jgi:hypothetical protein